MSNKLNLLLILFLLCSCAADFQLKSKTELQKVNAIRQIKTDFVPGKSLYNKLGDITYIKQKNENLVHIYKATKKINTIGGFGSGGYSFNKVSDIALAPDGYLLILDSFQKNIKKFDVEGKLIAEFQLEGLAKPVLMDISLDETIFLYDEARKELSARNISDQSGSFSFGKFILTKPVSLQINGGLVQVFDVELNSTLIFNLWGDLVQEYDGFVQLERGNQFRLYDHYLSELTRKKQLAVNVNKWNSFSLKYGFIIMNSENEVQVFDLIYED